MDAPTKLKILDIGQDGNSTQVGTLDWDGKKWVLNSEQDVSCISAMIDAGMFYARKSLSWKDQDLYLPLINSRCSMFRFASE